MKLLLSMLWIKHITENTFYFKWIVNALRWWDNAIYDEHIFRAFDHNGDGSISQGELREAMTRFGQTFTEEECEEVLLL